MSLDNLVIESLLEHGERIALHSFFYGCWLMSLENEHLGDLDYYDCLIEATQDPLLWA